MAGEIKPGDLYRKCPEPKCHYGTISEYEQGPNATHTSRCWTCNGIGFVRVDAPAPTDALRAAAQAMSDAYEAHVSAVDRHDKDDEFHSAMAMSDANDALRAALGGVPAPAALTEAELRSLADAVFAATNDEMSVSLVLAKLRELRPELKWLVAT